MTSPRETAEKLWKSFYNTDNFTGDDIDRITAELEDAERAGYVRRIEDSANVAFESFGTCGECVSNIGHSIRALKDVKP